MPIISRPYLGEEDKTRIADLVNSFPEENLHTADLPYRLSSWALDKAGNARLWLDEDRLVAWAVMQTPFWTIDVALHPAAPPEFHRDILAWADCRAQELVDSGYGHPAWYINVFEDQASRIKDLEAAGFASQANVGEDSWSKVYLQRPGQLEVKQFRLPQDFALRPLQGEDEVEAYVELHQSVFESKNMTAAWRRRALHHPAYRPDLDLVVAAPDGRLAAFCIGWLTQSSALEIRGQVEPLGCHQDFRKYALGRVVLAEVLRRLQMHGVRQIFVETDNYRSTAFALYESLGFHLLRNVLVYRKDYL
jgi:mycothiol synthase